LAKKAEDEDSPQTSADQDGEGENVHKAAFSKEIDD
jgi:hypothetical protein